MSSSCCRKNTNASSLPRLVCVVVLACSYLSASLAFTTTTTTTNPAATITNTRSSSSSSSSSIKQPLAFVTTSSSQQTSTSLNAFMTEVSDFYATYPLQSAVLTCGVKASLADGIAQWKSHHTSIQTKRNLAYVLYGGIFVGLMCHLEYNHLFPILFGNEHTLEIIVKKVLFDDFISAPLMWLPPAYLIKAFIYDYPLKEGLQKYWSDITEQDLLLKYWTIWVPAQTISFSVVPDHLRVAFMASVSFFWFILFSTVSSKNDDNTTNTNPEQPALASATNNNEN